MESHEEHFVTAARDVLGLRLPGHDRYAAWERCAKLGGIRWMHSEFCLASDFPDYIRINSRGQPHCETGPSHRWSDGWSIWHLNGVQVPQWLVETRADDLEPRDILKLQCYTATGREFVRKVGIEHICSSLNARCVDKKGNYELLMLDFGNGHKEPYLKLTDSTTGTWTLEDLARDCDTVEKALARPGVMA